MGGRRTHSVSALFFVFLSHAVKCHLRRAHQRGCLWKTSDRGTRQKAIADFIFRRHNFILLSNCCPQVAFVLWWLSCISKTNIAPNGNFDAFYFTCTYILQNEQTSPFRYQHSPAKLSAVIGTPNSLCSEVTISAEGNSSFLTASLSLLCFDSCKTRCNSTHLRAIPESLKESLTRKSKVPPS